MTKLNQVYQCSVCGNITEVAHASAGTLACCNKPMVLLEENSTDAATEKHVPVVEKIDGGYKVSVGSVLHPMQDDHFIEWIELVTPTGIMREYLKPGDEPIATFKTDATEVYAREFCTLHGHWKSK